MSYSDFLSFTPPPPEPVPADGRGAGGGQISDRWNVRPRHRVFQGQGGGGLHKLIGARASPIFFEPKWSSNWCKKITAT